MSEIAQRRVPDPTQEYDHEGHPVDGKVRYVLRPSRRGQGLDLKAIVERKRRRRRRHVVRAPVVPLGPRVCKCCNVEFEPAAPSQRYCEPACRKLYYRLGFKP